MALPGFCDQTNKLDAVQHERAHVFHLAHAPFLRGLGGFNVLGIPKIQLKLTIALNETPAWSTATWMGHYNWL